MFSKTITNQKRPFVVSERRGTFIILTIAILTIVVIVITGVVADSTLDQHTSKIVLAVLIALLVFVGLVSFGFLECQKKKSERKREAAAQRYSTNDAVDHDMKFVPSAPPLSSRTSWAYAAPFRYSTRSTLLAGK